MAGKSEFRTGPALFRFRPTGNFWSNLRLRTRHDRRPVPGLIAGILLFPVLSDAQGTPADYVRAQGLRARYEGAEVDRAGREPCGWPRQRSDGTLWRSEAVRFLRPASSGRRTARLEQDAGEDIDGRAETAPDADINEGGWR
jgi:hypothetical protein